MAADVVIGDELPLEVLGQVVECGAGVGKLGVATRALGRKLNGSEEREACSTEVVAGIGVEESVALVCILAAAGYDFIEHVCLPCWSAHERCWDRGQSHRRRCCQRQRARGDHIAACGPQ